MDNNYEAYKYADLIVKHLKGELSALEEIRLKEWMDQDPENADLVEKFQNEDLLKADLDLFDSLDKRQAWHNIASRTQKTSLSGQIVAIIQKWKYAAILVFALSTVILVYRLNRSEAIHAPAKIAAVVKYKHDIAPGRSGAILTLSNGLKFDLDADHIKAFAESDISINRSQGLITYHTAAFNNSGTNTISTPLGYKYKIILPDGSKVWLNSSSSLKFPVAFNGNERRVFLTGEAYFEVTKNKLKPFKVSANNTIVQVLGTHFNVKAYKDENEVKATLIEGSIKIIKGTQSKMVIPGQQARINISSPKIDITEANLDQSVAWKNDVFRFDSEDIRSVMKQVARWYNVEVQYKDDIKPFHFSGSVSRNNNISEILNMLELTGGVHFDIEDRKVIVTR